MNSPVKDHNGCRPWDFWSVHTTPVCSPVRDEYSDNEFKLRDKNVFQKSSVKNHNETELWDFWSGNMRIETPMSPMSGIEVSSEYVYKSLGNGYPSPPLYSMNRPMQSPPPYNPMNRPMQSPPPNSPMNRSMQNPPSYNPMNRPMQSPLSYNPMNRPMQSPPPYSPMNRPIQITPPYSPMNTPMQSTPSYSPMNRPMQSTPSNSPMNRPIQSLLPRSQMKISSLSSLYSTMRPPSPSLPDILMRTTSDSPQIISNSKSASCSWFRCSEISCENSISSSTYKQNYAPDSPKFFLKLQKARRPSLSRAKSFPLKDTRQDGVRYPSPRGQ